MTFICTPCSSWNISSHTRTCLCSRVSPSERAQAFKMFADKRPANFDPMGNISSEEEEVEDADSGTPSRDEPEAPADNEEDPKGSSEPAEQAPPPVAAAPAKETEKPAAAAPVRLPFPSLLLAQIEPLPFGILSFRPLKNQLESRSVRRIWQSWRNLLEYPPLKPRNLRPPPPQKRQNLNPPRRKNQWRRKQNPGPRLFSRTMMTISSLASQRKSQSPHL